MTTHAPDPAVLKALGKPLSTADPKVVARVAARLSLSPDLTGPDGKPCLMWDKPLANGYGRVINGKSVPAHRAIHELFIGPIPAGYWVDHLCHAQNERASRGCCRPSHLEAVTPAVNTTRAIGLGKHCKCGQELSRENLYVSPNGKTRQCRKCRRAAAERRRLRKLGLLPPHVWLTREERFMAKVSKPNGDEGCWLWTGATNGDDCGSFSWSSEEGMIPAYRASHRLFIGDIPEGLVVDHVKARECTTRMCVNPAHLEAVTQRENTVRGHVFKGLDEPCPKHPDAEVYANTGGYRVCRECRRKASRLSIAKRKAKDPEAFAAANREAGRRSRAKRKAKDPEAFAAAKREANRRSYAKKKAQAQAA